MSAQHRRTLTLDEPLGDNIAPPIGQFIEDHDGKLVGQLQIAPTGTRTQLTLTLGCDLAEANALEQYLRDRYHARGIRVFGTGPLETIRYDDEPPEAFFRSMSRNLIHKHGPLHRVLYVSHFPRFEIWFEYSDGVRLYSGARTGTYDLHFLTLGYTGEGPRYARAFLAEAGFSLTEEDIDAIRPGAVIELRDGRPSVSYDPSHIRKDDARAGRESSASAPRKWWKFWK